MKEWSIEHQKRNGGWDGEKMRIRTDGERVRKVLWSHPWIFADAMDEECSAPKDDLDVQVYVRI